MAWLGNCSEYEESDEGDATGSDIDDLLSDDELIIVLRDEQVKPKLITKITMNDFN